MAGRRSGGRRTKISTASPSDLPQLLKTPTELQDASAITTIPTSLPNSAGNMSQPARLLVCSIGNPGPYLNTFHSAGHTVVEALARTIPSQPPFHKSKKYASGLLSAGDDYYFWQSPSAMNTSGQPVKVAWQAFCASLHPSETAKLVIIHDEMEAKLGQIRVRTGNFSPKGHNGLKSIRDQLRSKDYTRIGIGIGRPINRDTSVVSAYVLRNMNTEERTAVEGTCMSVLEELEKLRLG